jgi:hypothetical protein
MKWIETTVAIRILTITELLPMDTLDVLYCVVTV